MVFDPQRKLALYVILNENHFPFCGVLLVRKRRLLAPLDVSGKYVVIGAGNVGKIVEYVRLAGG